MTVPRITRNHDGQRLVEFNGRRHLVAYRRAVVRHCPGSAADLYVCGPMTGLPHLNYPAFMAAEAQLQALGWRVRNPVHNGVPQDADYEAHMTADILMMRECAGVALLPGWEASRGAAREINEATRLGLVIEPLAYWVELLTLE